MWYFRPASGSYSYVGSVKEDIYTYEPPSDYDERADMVILVRKTNNKKRRTELMAERVKSITAVIAAAALGILSIQFNTYIGAVLALLLIITWIFGDKSNSRGAWALNIIWACTAAYVNYFISGWMLHPKYDFAISSFELVLNIMCIFIVYAVLYFITGRAKLSALTGSFLLAVLSTANVFVYTFRGKELGPMDLLSVTTAANVAGQYSFDITRWMTGGWAMWLAVALAQLGIPDFKKRPLRSRICALLAMVIPIGVLYVGAKDKPIKTWETEGTRLNGYFLNFALALRDSAVQKPLNYSAKNVEEYSQKYTANENEGDKPDIIVIMDEAYADCRILGENFNTNIPVTPFIDLLTENTIKGRALTSVYGGNTANSEFEFLTGQSMAFLPGNTVPYQQYIRSDTYSLAWVMNSYGYKTLATHPYLANGWSRPKVYPHFGFSESTFIEAYPSEDFVREYISDREMFEYVAEYAKNTQEPLFLFGVTMQNHSSYDNEEYCGAIKLEGFDGEYRMAEQYLSLIHETDRAVEYLIKTLSKSPKKTVVLFFGDHLPNVEPGFYDEIHGGMFNTLPEQMLQYTVPFFIWANYDIEEAEIECTSLNYLSNYLLKTAGLELPEYNGYLDEVSAVLPAMNAMGYFSLEQGEFIPYAQATADEARYLKEYSQVQYNNLFDTKNRNDIFFGQYIGR